MNTIRVSNNLESDQARHFVKGYQQTTLGDKELRVRVYIIFEKIKAYSNIELPPLLGSTVAQW